ncbi:MAG: hypothetical protein WBW75_22020 [Mycobacterium sp.]|uniref:hypothetical protein n=1 Tax=Mycobacterium sp. TaxID=1785 RepID=UPI003C486FFF
MMPFATPIDPYREGDSETYMTVPECAEVMHISEERVRQLMRLGVLRTRYHWGSILVQPAAVAGYTA